MTFSIIAFDPITNQWGVAVASRVMSVGSYVPHGLTLPSKPHSRSESKTALVASQSLIPNYGATLVKLLLEEKRLSLESGSERLIEVMRSFDPYLEKRQIAAIDESGRLFYFGGKELVPVATQHVDQKYHASAQGNMLSNPFVTQAMLDAYIQCRRNSSILKSDSLPLEVKGIKGIKGEYMPIGVKGVKGIKGTYMPIDVKRVKEEYVPLDFAECLLTALAAGELAGGDKRVESPYYSAALYIVAPCEVLGEPEMISDNCEIDLREDHSEHPIQDLFTLYELWKSR